MIPIFNYISCEEVISRIKIQLRIQDTSEHDFFLEILLREGLGSLNALTQLQKKQCCLEVEDNKMKLPGDFVKLIAFRPKTWITNTDTDNINTCGRSVYADFDFLNNCGCSTSGVSRFGYQINKGFIFFNSDTGITQGEIAYLGLWLDDEGKRVIHERYERGLTAYACWKFSLSWYEKYNQYIIESYHREWVNQKEKLYSEDRKADHDLHRREISEILRAWIVSPLVNYR